MPNRVWIFVALTWAVAPGLVRADHDEVVVSQPVLVDALPPAPSVGSRLDEIRRRIHDALHYPSLARARALEGRVHVAFEIDASFRAKDVETVHSCGHAILDRAAREAVSQASPLPYVAGRLVIPIDFQLRDAP